MQRNLIGSPRPRQNSALPMWSSRRSTGMTLPMVGQGIMRGLGEERNEVLQVMDDLRSANVDFLTMGQYLQPTRKHQAVARFVPPEEFKAYETLAYAKGFLMVSASPLTRSSHHAGEDFARLKLNRYAH